MRYSELLLGHKLNINHTGGNRPFSNLVKRCSVSEDGPVREETTVAPPPNEGPVLMPAAAPAWHRRVLASLTMLSAARIPEEFGSVRMRLQQVVFESPVFWLFDPFFELEHCRENSPSQLGCGNIKFQGRSGLFPVLGPEKFPFRVPQLCWGILIATC